MSASTLTDTPVLTPRPPSVFAPPVPEPRRLVIQVRTVGTRGRLHLARGGMCVAISRESSLDAAERCATRYFSHDQYIMWYNEGGLYHARERYQHERE